MHPSVTIQPGVLDRVQQDQRPVHVVVIATKPDIIKQAPLILALRERGEQVLVVHSGQHYDWNLSRGMEADFDIVPDINLNVRGERLYEQQARILRRFGDVIHELRRRNPRLVPYTYGDTTTAVAAGIAAFANRVPVAHVEAGLRTLSPPRELLHGLLDRVDPEAFFEATLRPDGWRKGSYEPFPEQFDTRASAPSAGLHLAPVALNREHLVAEGYDPEHVVVVGNPVVDAIAFARARANTSDVLDRFPKLREGGFVRFCVHRRENVTSRHRFLALYRAMERLVRDGRHVLLISLGATERALAAFGLKAEVEQLAATHENFIYSPVWPSYIDVVVAMERCALIATDSGSIQEEANALGIPLATLRFNTDRPETVFAGANLLAPPISADIVYTLVRAALDHPGLRARMIAAPKLYGEQVGRRMVDVATHAIGAGSLFEWLEHERLGFARMPFWEPGGTEW